MSPERHPENSTSSPLTGRYIKSFVFPITRKMIERNPNDEAYAQFAKSPDLIVAAMLSLAGLISLAAVELPLGPIAKRIQKALHPKK